MAKWIFCRRCNPNFVTGGLGGDLNTGIPNSCMSCVVLCARADFINQDVADQVMGVGNWAPGQTWALFNNGDDFDRDGSRPVAVTFSTVADPNDATQNIVHEISIGGGAFVWTRKSDDSGNPDFNTFELTSGEINTKVCDCGVCVTFDFSMHLVVLATDGPVQGFAVEADIDDFVDCNETVTLCMQPSLPGTTTACDGWTLVSDMLWVGIGDSYDGATPDSCRDGAELRLTAQDGCTDLFGMLNVRNSEACAIFHWEAECGHDPRTPPDETDFSINFTDTGCSGSLTSLAYGEDCEGGDITNCPPEDCPASFCIWIWNIDTQDWDLVFTNCLEGFVCGDPPADPDDTGSVHIECTCCVENPQPCGPGNQCPGPDTCGWVWDAGGSMWTTAGCAGSAEGCVCCGKPERVGAFDGEIVEGICCDATFGTGCNE